MSFIIEELSFDSLRRHHHYRHYHRHPEGLLYRSLCLKSSTFAVSETASRRWWCIESLFPRIRPCLLIVVMIVAMMMTRMIGVLLGLDPESLQK